MFDFLEMNNSDNLNDDFSHNSNENDNKKANENCLSHREVAALLPDYLFNRLSLEERTEFEISIINYHDLETELEEGKKLFAQIEKIDYKQILNDKSQYLSDKVVARLESRNLLYSTKPPNYRRLILIGMFAASLLFFMFLKNGKVINPFEKDDSDSINISDNSGMFNANDYDLSYSNGKELFSELEKSLIFDSFDELETDLLLENVNDVFDDKDRDYAFTKLNNSEVAQQFTEFIDESFPDIIELSYDFTNTNFDYQFFLDNIGKIDENSFQNLLNMIDNQNY